MHKLILVPPIAIDSQSCCKGAVLPHNGIDWVRLSQVAIYPQNEPKTHKLREALANYRSFSGFVRAPSNSTPVGTSSIGAQLVTLWTNSTGVNVAEILNYNYSENMNLRPKPAETDRSQRGRLPPRECRGCTILIDRSFRDRLLRFSDIIIKHGRAFRREKLPDKDMVYIGEDSYIPLATTQKKH
jgi:hypothetical protein